MELAEMREIGARYQAAFGGIDEIVHPAIMFEPEFLQLLEKAVARGTPLTRTEVETVFPDVSWEW